MKKGIHLLAAACLIFLVTCQQESEDLFAEYYLESVPVSSYFPMEKGNYWIYEVSVCDSLGKNCKSAMFDTVFIIKDTTINSNEFYVIEGKHFGKTFRKFLRDSAQFIVNEMGEVQLTNAVFNETLKIDLFTTQLNDTLYYSETYAEDDDSVVKTSVDSYRCLALTTRIISKYNKQQIKLNTYDFYARNTGLVEETGIIINNMKNVKRELIEYEIK